ncbi:MAG: L,D-transpeptidase family protein [Hyphomicrobium aestuarii]|nr:L,D-transpeptidase family protein [Hyphomicrobium aestuarii]
MSTFPIAPISPCAMLRAALCAASIGSLLLASPAEARRRTELAPPKPQVVSSKDPLVVIVSLKRQRLTVYNRNGSVTEAPISSGNAENPTATGVFSILGKAVEHYSNLYDNAPMPYMQRLTWSGTAMHAGHLPGYPASHGCIRLPRAFSQRLYDMTSVNTRVIVSNADVAPRAISHDKLPGPPPPAEETVALDLTADPIKGDLGPSGGNRVASLGGAIAGVKLGRGGDVPVTAAAKARFAETRDLFEAIAPVDAEHATKLEAFKAARKALIVAQNDLEKVEDSARDATATIDRIGRVRDKLEGQLAAIGRRMDSPLSDRALEALMGAEDKIEAKLFDLASELELAQDTLSDVDTLRPEYQARIATASDANARASEAVQEANQALKDARSAYALKKREDARYMRPVSVFVSRKDQRLYVRQGFEPVLEVPVTITDADMPLGTHVYTAMGYSDDFSKLDWTVASVPMRDRDTGSKSQPRPATATATAALDRVQFPQEAMAAIAERMKPGSSLIISDETTSQHFGEGTDFTVATR